MTIDCTALGMSQEDPTIVVKPIEKAILGGAQLLLLMQNL